ncbi:MAG: hypothetical protein AAFQ83_24665, partial [Bacteroidota bacterium]
FRGSMVEEVSTAIVSGSVVVVVCDCPSLLHEKKHKTVDRTKTFANIFIVKYGIFIYREIEIKPSSKVGL